MIQAVIFDLDDTLYRERDFVASGYRAVAGHVASRTGLSMSDIHQAMMATLEVDGRRAVFPMVVSEFLDNSVPLSELLEVYRSHSPRIRLLPRYGRLLKRLRTRFRLGIITDGLPQVQKGKVKALGLLDAVDHIIYTWELGPEREKPDPLSFSMMLRALQVEPLRAVYVGDHYAKDCVGAHRAGMRCIKIAAHGGNGVAACQESETADFTIESLLQLPRLLRTVD